MTERKSADHLGMMIASGAASLFLTMGAFAALEVESALGGLLPIAELIFAVASAHTAWKLGRSPSDPLRARAGIWFVVAIALALVYGISALREISFMLWPWAVLLFASIFQRAVSANAAALFRLRFEWLWARFVVVSTAVIPFMLLGQWPGSNQEGAGGRLAALMLIVWCLLLTAGNLILLRKSPGPNGAIRFVWAFYFASAPAMAVFNWMRDPGLSVSNPAVHGPFMLTKGIAFLCYCAIIIQDFEKAPEGLRSLIARLSQLPPTQSRLRFTPEQKDAEG